MTPPRVLLLEDDAALRESLARVLRRRGYEVDEVGRSADAIEAARRAAYDLVVTDIRMEGPDGLDALEHVKGVQPDVGSLVITGYGTEADSIRAIRLGVGDYLKKPFHLKTFLDSVETVLQGRRREATLSRREAALTEAVIFLLEELLSLRGLPEAADPGRRAAQAGLALGLSEPAARGVQVATLARLLERLPSGVGQILRPPEGSLEDRIVAAVLELPGHDEELLAGLPQEGRAPLELGGSRRRQLLLLARALQESDPQGSRQALEAVLEEGQETREGVHALLRLAREALEQGRREEGEHRALRAVGWARRLGPNTGSEACLEAGTLLWSHGFPEGRELVGQAARLAETVGSAPVGVLARLAVAHFDGEPEPPELSFEPLTLPENLAQLESSLAWLVPWLLDHPEPELLARLAMDYPDALGAALQAGLSVPARLTAVAALAAAGTAQAEKWLRDLLADPDEQVRSQAHRALQQLEPGAPLLRLHSLGSFLVFRGGERIQEWKTQKVRYLLAYLAASGDREVPEEVLMDAFWPDAPPPRARKSLNTALSYLRAQVRLEADPISRTPTGIRLRPDLPRWHDVDELTDLLDRPATDRLSHHRRIARLFRGPYLEGCYLDWAVERRHLLESRVGDVLEELAELCLAAGHPEEAVEHGQRCLDIDPCRQRVHQLLLQAHLQQGRPEEAVRQFELCERSLREELGMEPSTEMLRGYHRALLSLD